MSECKGEDVENQEGSCCNYLKHLVWKNADSCTQWWHMPVTPALGKLKQEDSHFKTSLNCIGKPWTLSRETDVQTSRWCCLSWNFSWYEHTCSDDVHRNVLPGGSGNLRSTALGSDVNSSLDYDFWSRRERGWGLFSLPPFLWTYSHPNISVPMT